MICTKCGGETKTIDSRKRRGTVIRRRECLVCGYRFSTEEILLQKEEQPQTEKQLMNALFNRKYDKKRTSLA